MIYRCPCLQITVAIVDKCHSILCTIRVTINEYDDGSTKKYPPKKKKKIQPISSTGGDYLEVRAVFQSSCFVFVLYLSRLTNTVTTFFLFYFYFYGNTNLSLWYDAKLDLQYSKGFTSNVFASENVKINQWREPVKNNWAVCRGTRAKR